MYKKNFKYCSKRNIEHVKAMFKALKKVFKQIKYHL